MYITHCVQFSMEEMLLRNFMQVNLPSIFKPLFIMRSPYEYNNNNRNPLLSSCIFRFVCSLSMFHLRNYSMDWLPCDVGVSIEKVCSANLNLIA
jgi:hypothetical protein